MICASFSGGRGKRAFLIFFVRHMRGTMSTGVTMQAEPQQRPNSERGGIVVLDFGGQYTQLIARRIREQQVFSSILPCTASVEEIRKLEPVGVVLSGGPSSVYDKEAPK